MCKPTSWRIVFLSFALLSGAGALHAKVTTDKLGSIKCEVLDAVLQSPIPGASVLISGTQIGASTDDAGVCVIGNVTIGTYVLTVQSLGYEPRSIGDIVVRPGRITEVRVELQSSSIELQGVSVTSPPRHFEDQPGAPTSNVSFSTEEVRRSPGSGGWDVTRVFTILPSVAKVNDQMNSLIVRGGTPSENGFYVDGIPIPNINHFPLQGTSGGPIGLINVDFVRDADFSAGGFSSIYGDRLSSIVTLGFRDGNREEFDGQLDLNFAGFGASLEGPAPGRRGAWLFSARRSYLDLVVEALGQGIAPRYSDYQGKFTYDLTPSATLTLLGIAGIDFVEFDKEQAIEDGNIAYGKWDSDEYAAGMNLRKIWGARGVSEFVLSTMATRFGGEFFEVKSAQTLSREDSRDQQVFLRNVNTVRLGPRSHIETGVDGQYNLSDYDTFYGEYTNPYGDTIPEMHIRQDVESPKGGAFLSLTFEPVYRLQTTLGMRVDHFDYNSATHVSPRLSLSYRLTDRTTLNGATGLYFQNLPLALLLQQPAHRELNDPLAQHYIAGIEHLWTENTQMTVEGYYKRYDDFPMDPTQPESFIADDVVSRGYYSFYPELESGGRADSYGIECVLQKKLVAGVYGLISGAYGKARYRGLDGIWRDRSLDNGVIIGLEGGYKPNRNWEFSMRWTFAGGPPYTPLDTLASRAINRSVLDRTRVNEERQAAYHSMNIRVDRHFYFRQSSIILYLNVWNAYNRQNVLMHYWNEDEQKPDVLYQFSVLPVLGIEYEF
ncbi:MAG: TonB-dependent receptor [Candidatus Zixiibacteriota bacterium]